MKVKILINLRIGDKAFKMGDVYDYKDLVGVNPAYYEVIEKEKSAKIEVVKAKRKYTKKKK